MRFGGTFGQFLPLDRRPGREAPGTASISIQARELVNALDGLAAFAGIGATDASRATRHSSSMPAWRSGRIRSALPTPPRWQAMTGLDVIGAFA